MDTLTAIKLRHSTREFIDRPVPRDVLETIADAGRRAPTARNEQPWLFVAITEPSMREKIAELTDYGRFIAAAPACIAVFCKDTKYYLEDGCAAVENMLIAATALGVQSCWVAGDKKAYCPAVAQLLGVPAGHKLIALLPMGYAALRGGQKPRRSLSEVLRWEKY